MTRDPTTFHDPARVSPSRPRRGRAPVDGVALARTAIIGLFVIALTAAVYVAAPLVVPVTLALVFGMVLGPVCDRMIRRGLPPFAAAALIVVAGIAAVHGLVAAFAYPTLEWLDRAPEIWDAMREKLAPVRLMVEQLNTLSDTVEQAAGMSGGGLQVDMRKGMLASAVTMLPELAAQLVLFIGTLFFFLATRRELRRALLGLCIHRRARLTAAHIISDAESALSRYFGTITAINVVLGLATAALAYAYGLPAPALWGVLGAVLNYAPYVGPALVTAILFGVGIVSTDTLTQAMLPPLTFVALQTVEGQFITPAVLGRQLTLNPLVIFIAIAFWLWLWGPVGAFVAVPLVLIGSVAVDRLAGRNSFETPAGPALPQRFRRGNQAQPSAVVHPGTLPLVSRASERTIRTQEEALPHASSQYPDR
ncbi:AI-2E family transporter [Chthonobacter albigriseus]|uniref:AI-2E family transporter n=1 Tax=Chthonobacter albigriseus TaxID=1683161 RepID=UPI0015EF0186|nr:AI-2E family transporter [Chthonobacter albigriseus]